MPTNLLGATLYVFALFPGVAFLFAREGHQPAVKRSAWRETATVVFVSTLCDALIAGLVAVVSLWWGELHLRLGEMLRGDFTWASSNPSAIILIAVLGGVVATALGWLFGSRWAYDLGLRHIWNSEIPRDTSAWRAVFGEEKVAFQVAAILKSGAWVAGYLYAWDNQVEADPHRSLILSKPRYRPPGGEDVTELVEVDYLLIEAGEIEQLHVTRETRSESEVSAA